MYIKPTFDLNSGVLRPTFYSLYINDTSEAKPNNLTTFFADDFTEIITTDKTRKTRLCNRTLTLRTQKS